MKRIEYHVESEGGRIMTIRVDGDYAGYAFPDSDGSIEWYRLNPMTRDVVNDKFQSIIELSAALRNT